MAPERPSYGMTKNASTLLVQQIAKDTNVMDMQVVSFHPGAIATEEVARRLGSDDTLNIAFDNGKPSPRRKEEDLSLAIYMNIATDG